MKTSKTQELFVFLPLHEWLPLYFFALKAKFDISLMVFDNFGQKKEKNGAGVL